MQLPLSVVCDYLLNLWAANCELHCLYLCLFYSPKIKMAIICGSMVGPPWLVKRFASFLLFTEVL